MKMRGSGMHPTGKTTGLEEEDDDEVEGGSGIVSFV